MLRQRIIEGMPIQKKWIRDCFEYTARNELQKLESSPERILLSLTTPIIYTLLQLAAEDDTQATLEAVGMQGSPENLLFVALGQEAGIAPLLERLQPLMAAKEKEAALSAKTPDQLRKVTKDKMETEVNINAAALVANLSPEVVQQITTTRLMQLRERKMQEIEHERQLMEQNLQQARSDAIHMDVHRLLDPTRGIFDPLYTPEMVEGLIRLRLGDPQPAARREGKIASLGVADRVWLGFFNLSDSKHPDHAKIKEDYRALLRKALNTCDPNRETYISVRAANIRMGSGHYELFGLIPDGKSGTILRLINSLESDKDITVGIPNEVAILAREAGLNIVGFETQQLMRQHTDHGCGPTHVEITSGVMTQQSYLGPVARDYQQLPVKVFDEANAENLIICHAHDLLANAQTRNDMLEVTRDVFPLVMTEHNSEVCSFGWVPPTPDSLARLLPQGMQMIREARPTGPVMGPAPQAAAKVQDPLLETICALKDCDPQVAQFIVDHLPGHAQRLDNDGKIHWMMNSDDAVDRLILAGYLQKQGKNAESALAEARKYPSAEIANEIERNKSAAARPVPTVATQSIFAQPRSDANPQDRLVAEICALKDFDIRVAQFVAEHLPEKVDRLDHERKIGWVLDSDDSVNRLALAAYLHKQGKGVVEALADAANRDKYPNPELMIDQFKAQELKNR